MPIVTTKHLEIAYADAGPADAPGPDGTMYVTASHIQDTCWFKPEASPSITTQLFSFKPIAPA